MTNDIYRNKKILITGASSRTGRAIADYLLKTQASLFLCCHNNPETIEAIIKDHPTKIVFPLQGDLSREEEVLRIREEVKKETPVLDGLINVFGEYLDKPFQTTDYSEWQFILNNNLNSVFLMCRHFFPLLKNSTRARVINFGYANGNKISTSRAPAYHIAKMGVISLTKSMAQEWGPYNISANVISPGTLSNSIIKTSQNPGDYIPQQRFGEFSDIWPVLDMLFREDSTYTTGNNFIISGAYNV